MFICFNCNLQINNSNTIFFAFDAMLCSITCRNKLYEKIKSVDPSLTNYNKWITYKPTYTIKPQTIPCISYDDYIKI